MSSVLPRPELAPAKINLTLHIHGRRADGYHDLESLVTFADLGDALTLVPGDEQVLTVGGPTAQISGPTRENLVLRAAQALAARIPGLKSGAFDLSKQLPVAAGIGGGSADAAAALRLLARLNGLTMNDIRVLDAARTVGADVPVCLESQTRIMKGAGERLGPVLRLPKLPAVLVNPGVPVATAEVFGKLALNPGDKLDLPPHFNLTSAVDAGTLLALLAGSRNDLQDAAISVAPVIADVIADLGRQPGCALARMSGSGATCFGVFQSMGAAFDAVRALRKSHSNWWIQPVNLGSMDP